MKKLRYLVAAFVASLSLSLAAADISTSVDDILAGKTVRLTGDVSLAGSTLRITGTDFSGLDRNRSYDIAVTEGGVFTGSPQIISSPLPEGWQIRVRGSRITLRATGGTVRIVLEGTR